MRRRLSNLFFDVILPLLLPSPLLRFMPYNVIAHAKPGEIVRDDPINPAQERVGRHLAQEHFAIAQECLFQRANIIEPVLLSLAGSRCAQVRCQDSRLPGLGWRDRAFLGHGESRPRT